jgi:hypothetical protein
LQPHPAILAWAPEALWQQVDLGARDNDMRFELAIAARSDPEVIALRLWRLRCSLRRRDTSDLGAASDRGCDASRELGANGERASGQ